jgi:succinate--hydroxymethylglutarate CoA-transferase
MMLDVEHPTIGPLRLLGTPLKLSRTPPAVRTAPPTLGQHTDEVLREDLGLTRAEIEELRAKGIV